MWYTWNIILNYPLHVCMLSNFRDGICGRKKWRWNNGLPVFWRGIATVYIKYSKLVSFWETEGTVLQRTVIKRIRVVYLRRLWIWPLELHFDSILFIRMYHTSHIQMNKVSSFFFTVLVAQSCLILCDPMDHSPPGSSVHGIFQARILEWIAIPFSRRSSQPRDWTQVSCSVRQILYHLSQ